MFRTSSKRLMYVQFMPCVYWEVCFLGLNWLFKIFLYCNIIKIKVWQFRPHSEYKKNLDITFFMPQKMPVPQKKITKVSKLSIKIFRSIPPEVFLGKGVLKICSKFKFTGEHPCRSTISIKLQSNFIKITLRHGCSPVHFLHIFRSPFPKNTSGWLLLDIFWDTAMWSEKHLHQLFLH